MKRLLVLPCLFLIIITSFSQDPWKISATSIDPSNYYGITVGALVPEPESYMLFMAGLGLVGVIARRRKQNKPE